MKRFYQRLTTIHPELPKYLMAILLISVCSGVFENTFNNYLYSQFKVSPTVRGNLEFVREFPGLMNAPLMGALSWLSETRVAGLSAWVTALGMVGLGLKGQNWWLMLLCTIFWGIGSHLIMPVRSSLTMELGGQTKRARRLGQVGAVGIVGSIIGGVIVWVVFNHVGEGQQEGVMRPIDEWGFDLTFYIAALACVGSGIFFHLLRNIGAHTKRPGFVLKRKYWLYYVLNVLFGARKQVFLTFGRWVIVTVFQRPPSVFAVLSIIASVIGIPLNQFLGQMVDRFGERNLMLCNAAMLFAVCMGYATAQHLGLSPAVTLAIIYVTYVVDQLVFAMEMARDTYMSKIAETKEDLTASLSVGVTINHIVAMSVPSLGGLLWARHGYEAVFLVGAGIAVLMCIFSSMVRVPRSIDLAEGA
jgi:nitrate/nitrite transporter NarK